MPQATPSRIPRCSPDDSLESLAMLGMHFAFSLLYMTTTPTRVKSSHDQLFGVDTRGKRPGLFKDGKTVLDDPVDDSGFSLSDHLLPEKSFSYSLPDMVDSSANKDDPLRDVIAEVYGPPMKC